MPPPQSIPKSGRLLTSISATLPVQGLWQNLGMDSAAKSTAFAKQQGNRSLRDQVDELLPGWQSWYPSLFDAAQDLGILRARVCDLSTLVLSNRHASVYNEAVQAFRNQWSVEEPEELHDHDHRSRHQAPDKDASEEINRPPSFPDLVE